MILIVRPSEGLMVVGHFRTILISSRQKVLYEDLGKYSYFKSKISEFSPY